MATQFDPDRTDIKVILVNGLYINPSTLDEDYRVLKVDPNGFIITTTDETS